MTMNSSGPISLGGSTAGQSINLENGFSATAQVSLNDTAVRNLAGVASGAITMPTNFYGKSNVVNISYTYSANTANASLNVSSISGYSAGKSNITITINSGVYLYATSTANAGLTLTGGTTGDTITIVNNGYIMGQGGTGGNDNASTNPPQSGVTAPTAGGNAINISGIGISGLTINNTNASAYIGGGGGGGGATWIYWSSNVNYRNTGNAGGGGAGGGVGGLYQTSREYSCTTYTYTAPGGTGGSVGASGGNGSVPTGTYAVFVYSASGGGGGRIFPGTGGAGSAISNNTATTGKGGGSGGSGGGGAIEVCCSIFVGSGGGGGGWGASGGGGYGGNGGLGSTYSGGSGSSAGAGSGTGASGGKAVNLGGKTVTWTSGNTTRVYGAVS